ncbi:MAG: JDVT-CTERM system glutamic-type intramembrane protease MrtJ [Gammaproteobacteria bacterium]
MPSDLLCGPQLLNPDAGALIRLLVLAPALEEWVLRAGLQHWWLRRGYGAVNGVLLCAAVFCVLHAGAGWQRALLVGPPALVLGALYQRWRRWWLCAAVHCAMNAFALLACL